MNHSVHGFLSVHLASSSLNSTLASIGGISQPLPRQVQALQKHTDLQYLVARVLDYLFDVTVLIHIAPITVEFVFVDREVSLYCNRGIYVNGGIEAYHRLFVQREGGRL